MIEEPLQLRADMRVLAALAPAQVRPHLAAEVAALIAAQLGPAGGVVAPSDELVAICAGYERELWLWVVGERKWNQCASGLSGRLARRAASFEGAGAGK